MKKLINHPVHVVEEMIEGLVAINPGLRRLPDQTVVVRADAEAVRDRRIASISGGGSGHEPAHAECIGREMLSAAVAGDVFTSPSPDAVLAAIRFMTGPPGTLLTSRTIRGTASILDSPPRWPGPNGCWSRPSSWPTTRRSPRPPTTRAAAGWPGRSSSTRSPARRPRRG